MSSLSLVKLYAQKPTRAYTTSVADAYILSLIYTLFIQFYLIQLNI